MKLIDLANAINALRTFVDPDMEIEMYHEEQGHMGIKNISMVIDKDSTISLVINAL